MIDGLPDDATDDDILDGFASVSPDSRVFSADNVRAIRLRHNKRGRRIGFVEFVDVNAAADFLEFHYPGLRFQLAHSRGVNSEMISVGINYSWGREDEAAGRDDRGRDSEDWNCPEVRPAPQMCRGLAGLLLMMCSFAVSFYEFWLKASMSQMSRSKAR